ncbi:MAG: hypothetical protein AB1641_19970 [Thermodesulfobacteriota bacterium]
MTLVLTEVSPLGITMAADSAVTIINTITGLSHVRNNAAQKLRIIPYLNAAISCWGLGTINCVSTDHWLANFISAKSTINNLGDFAITLENELNSLIPPNPNPQHSRLGFHLAGYEMYQGSPAPSFYHIHEGESTTLQQRGITINLNKFNANHDLPPAIAISLISQGQGWITRNGDYQLYVNIFAALETLFQQLLPLGIRIPNSQNLSDRAEYLVFQIRTISEIYRLSNLIPGIGGYIHYVTISQRGLHSQGIMYY